MKKVILILSLLLFGAYAQAATLLPNGKQQFFDANGKPLVGGTVWFYVPNTQLAKDTWQDPDQTILNSNPIILDGSGEAIIYGSGAYRQVVKDVNGNLIWDQLTQDTSASSINFSSNVGGTMNAITVDAPNFTNQDGQVIAFVAIADNSGAVTLNANGGGALPVYKDTVNGPLTLQGGEIKTGNLINAQYLSTTNSYHLIGNNLASVLITGGSINDTIIGDITPASGSFTSVEVTDSSPPPNGLYLQSSGIVGISSNTSNNPAATFFSPNPGTDYLQFSSSNTPDYPSIASVGSSTDIGVNFSTKGNAGYLFKANNFSRTLVQLADTSSAINYFIIGNAPTTSPPTITAQGLDSDINIAVVPKGTGAFQCLPCYTNTTTGSGNLIINGSGEIRRTTSSRKFKKDIVNYDRGVDDLMKLRAVYFRSKIPGDSQRRQAGLIAEEVKASGLEEFVEYSDPRHPDEPKGVQYTAMIALMINSIKDLKHENDSLRARMLKLERANASVRSTAVRPSRRRVPVRP